jgi:hypothetical protein
VRLRPLYSALLFFLTIASAAPASASDSTETGARWLRHSLLFTPLRASHLEPRMALSRLVEQHRLRLDIGNSVDVVVFPLGTDAGSIAVGADAFTWTSLRQADNFHFPVDAVDYLFGINSSWRTDLSARFSLALRLRFSHISAHMVDGSYDKTTGAWHDGQLPRVYSREFIEPIVAAEYGDLLRVYAGGQYLTHVDPTTIGRWALQAGFEVAAVGFWVEWLHAYGAFDYKRTSIGYGVSNTSVQAGVKCGDWRGAGANLYVAYFDGYSQHGEYYDQHWKYWGPGLSVEF